MDRRIGRDVEKKDVQIATRVLDGQGCVEWQVHVVSRCMRRGGVGCSLHAGGLGRQGSSLI